MEYTVIKELGMGVMESPYTEHKTEFVYNNLDLAKEKAHQLFIKNVPENIRSSSWCNESYFVRDSNGKSYR